jgi:hypothetical protein
MIFGFLKWLIAIFVNVAVDLEFLQSFVAEHTFAYLLSQVISVYGDNRVELLIFRDLQDVMLHEAYNLNVLLAAQVLGRPTHEKKILVVCDSVRLRLDVEFVVGQGNAASSIICKFRGYLKYFEFGSSNLKFI